MPKRNLPLSKKPPRNKKFCLGKDKDRDEVYMAMLAIMSSEDEDSGDEDNIIDGRLDQIQNMTTDYDLLQLLSRHQPDTPDTYESNEQMSTSTPHLPTSASKADDRISPPDVRPPVPDNQHQPDELKTNEQMSTSNLPASASKADDRISPPDVRPPVPDNQYQPDKLKTNEQMSTSNLPASASKADDRISPSDVRPPVPDNQHQPDELKTNEQMSTSNLPASASTADDRISSPDVHSTVPDNHHQPDELKTNEQMSTFTAHLPANASKADDRISPPDVRPPVPDNQYQPDKLKTNEQMSTSNLPAVVDDQISPPEFHSPVTDNQHQPDSNETNEQVSMSTPHLPTSASTVAGQLTSSAVQAGSSRNEPSTAREMRPSYAQLQNRRWDWITDLEDHESPIFDKPIQVRKVYNNRSQPKEYFIDMFPDEAVEMIVKNTNIYAQFTHSKNWVEVTKEEMDAFLGIIILMSINTLSDYQLYWSTDPFFNNSFISNVMTLKRFKKIMENLHISDVTEEVPRTSPHYNKLNKVQPLIDILNVSFEEACEPSSTQSIDESMIRFKGRSTLKQYMPLKPIKRGYKCWARCDSQTGYLHQFQFYTGKIGSTTEENLGYRVVLDLSENVPSNTLLAFDRFFTSLGLLSALHQKQIFAVATTQSNRKGLPENVNKNTREERLNPGEFKFWYSRPVSLVKWKDSKDVFVASTAYSPREVSIVNRKQKDGTRKKMFCPLAIKKYTEYMGGVDLFDHYRSSYPLGRKSKKNWHRLFWFLWDAAIINAYIVYMQGHSERRNTHREIRLRLGRALINNFSSRKKAMPKFKSKKGGVYGVPDELRLADVGSHMPEIESFRRCRFCSTRAKEQRSKYVCSTCRVPCAAPCFARFHVNLYE